MTIQTPRLRSAQGNRQAVPQRWDLHQPLHSTTLFSQNLFPNGDRGGNSVKTEQSSNLHSLRDRFPGGTIQFRTARNHAIESVNDLQHSALGHAAAEDLDEKQWLDESFHVAITAAYDPEIMVLLRQWDAENESELPEIKLSQTYLQAGGRLSKQRVVQAGYRLGAVLKAALSD